MWLFKGDKSLKKQRGVCCTSPACSVYIYIVIVYIVKLLTCSKTHKLVQGNHATKVPDWMCTLVLHHGLKVFHIISYIIYLEGETSGGGLGVIAFPAAWLLLAYLTVFLPMHIIKCVQMQYYWWAYFYTMPQTECWTSCTQESFLIAWGVDISTHFYSWVQMPTHTGSGLTRQYHLSKVWDIIRSCTEPST